MRYVVTARNQNHVDYYLWAGRPAWNWKHARQATYPDTAEDGYKFNVFVQQSFRRICLQLNFSSGTVGNAIEALQQPLRNESGATSLALVVEGADLLICRLPSGY